MPWSSNGNQALWAGAFRHVVDVFRSVSPAFRFDWNGTGKYFVAHDAPSSYPGDAYVDVVGLDQYDMDTGGAYNSYYDLSSISLDSTSTGTAG